MDDWLYAMGEQHVGKNISESAEAQFSCSKVLRVSQLTK